MNWFEARISTTQNGIDPVTGVLLSMGINGFVIEDARDFNEFLTSTEYRWDYIDEDLMNKKTEPTSVIVYLPENDQGKHQLVEMDARLKKAREENPDIDFGTLEITLQNIREEDWANNWKQYFKPFSVGEKLLIKPTWEKAEDTKRTILNIDPGSSFGTGQHHTTKLCLERLEEIIKPEDRVLDLGCGSGILSIGAILLGAKSAFGVDIDENSVRIARENAAQNNILSDRFQTACGNIIDDEELRRRIGGDYHLIVANIVADVIIMMAPLFQSFMRPDGFLIVSGIIHRQKEEVRQALIDNGFDILSAQESNDWSCLVCRIAR